MPSVEIPGAVVVETAVLVLSKLKDGTIAAGNAYNFSTATTDMTISPGAFTTTSTETDGKIIVLLGGTYQIFISMNALTSSDKFTLRQNGNTFPSSDIAGSASGNNVLRCILTLAANTALTVTNENAGNVTVTNGAAYIELIKIN